MTQDFDPCHMIFAHSPHMWDTEERTPLRYSCPGVEFQPETQARAEYVAGNGDGDHAHHYSGQTLRHSHPHDGPHGYFQHPEDEGVVARSTREAAAYEAALSRVQSVISDGATTAALAVMARIAAAGDQPETQLAADLIRAEAALARVRALFATDPGFDGGGYEPCGTNPMDCTHAECDTARAVLEALDGAP